MEKQNGFVSSLLCLFWGMNMVTERLMAQKGGRVGTEFANPQ